MQEQATETAGQPYVGEEEDDASLMQQIAGGDQRAFARLVNRHLASTTRLAFRVLGYESRADDVAQEAFMRVWKHAPSFEDPAKRNAKFTTWLYRIVVNLCIDEKRKRKFSTLDNMPEKASDDIGAEQGMEKKEQSVRVRAALDKLPDRQRMAFVLCFYEDCSNKEAADSMGIGIKALESLLVRARKELRVLLQAERDTK